MAVEKRLGGQVFVGAGDLGVAVEEALDTRVGPGAFDLVDRCAGLFK